MASIALLVLVQVAIYWIASGEVICYYRKRVDEKIFMLKKGLCDYSELDILVTVKTDSMTESTDPANPSTTRAVVMTSLLSSIVSIPPTASIWHSSAKRTPSGPINGICAIPRSTVQTYDVTELATTLREATPEISIKKATTKTPPTDQGEATVISITTTDQTTAPTKAHTTEGKLSFISSTTTDRTTATRKAPTTEGDSSFISSTTTDQTTATTKTHTTDQSLSTFISSTTTDQTTAEHQESSIRTTEVTSVNNVCDSWTVYGSSCYLYVATDAPTWYDAAAQCASYHPNAHLVFIESDSENDFVATLIGPSPTPWIGLTDENIEDQWVWSYQGLSTDTSATYVNWDTDYRNNDLRDCAYIRGYSEKWQAYWCNTPEQFICEIEQ